MADIVKWMESEYKECLVIEGARQVGKTFIIEQFLKDRCSNYLKIDFNLQNDLRTIFDSDLKVDDIISEISIRVPNFKPIPYETVLFFDEIQLCPKVRSSLKEFASDGRYRVIASGSLLGLMYKRYDDEKGKENNLLPMGYERRIELRSLDFEEFLWAIGIDEIGIRGLRSQIREKKHLNEETLKKCNRYFKIYCVVGGMPDAVNRYLETTDINEVRLVQQKIIRGFRDDVSKYAKPSDQPKISACFDSIPYQLSKDNRKFSYSAIEADYLPAYDTYNNGIQWMCDAKITHKCYNVTEPASPLKERMIEKNFKLYLCDTGLLVCMLGLDDAHAIMTGDKRTNKGPAIENAVAQCLSACGIDLFFFKNDRLEINFMTMMRGQVTAMDVKSGNNKRARSLQSIHDNYKVKRRMKFEDTNVDIDKNGIEHYPLFVSAFADELYEPYDINIDFRE